jgi:hypothetical protein
MIQLIRKYLPAANRLVLGITAAVDLLAAAVSVLGDISSQQTVSVFVVLTLINAKSALFIKGWQQMEKALYQRDLIAYSNSAEADAAERAAQAARSVGRPGTGPKVTLPR